jgi:hypothetical protein
MLKLTLKEQKELLKYIYYYNSLDPSIVKSYLRDKIKTCGIKVSRIAKDINISQHTIYGILKTTGQNYKLDFLIFLSICNYLDLSITAITETTITDITAITKEV